MSAQRKAKDCSEGNLRVRNRFGSNSKPSFFKSNIRMVELASFDQRRFNFLYRPPELPEGPLSKEPHEARGATRPCRESGVGEFGS